MPSEINEVFQFPVVKQVIFQIRFPNLFFLEGRVGDFQLAVMSQFPESALLIQQGLFIAAGDREKLHQAVDQTTPPGNSKLWKFSSPSGVSLELKTESLTLASNRHKTYKTGTNDRFRDTIGFVLDAFQRVTQLPIATRVGLRYIDHCPISTDTSKAKDWYNLSFDIERFTLKELLDAHLVITRHVDGKTLRYQEAVDFESPKPVLALDFDAFTNNVDFSRILDTTDALHLLIRNEFLRTIKEPVIEHMRTGRGM